MFLKRSSFKKKGVCYWSLHECWSVDLIHSKQSHSGRCRIRKRDLIESLIQNYQSIRIRSVDRHPPLHNLMLPQAQRSHENDSSDADGWDQHVYWYLFISIFNALFVDHHQQYIFFKNLLFRLASPNWSSRTCNNKVLQEYQTHWKIRETYLFREYDAIFLKSIELFMFLSYIRY